ncbi:MAG: hypothetical protein AAF823_14125 [Planctomycetota bacterium]
MTPPPADAADTPSPTPHAAGQKRWPRRVAIGVACLAGAAALLVLAAPTLLSTGLGNGLILSVANGRIPGNASADSISIGWFAGASVRDLQLDDPDGQPVLTLASADAPDANLWRLATASNRYGQVQIADLAVHIVADDSGTTNLQRAIATPAAPSATPRTAKPDASPKPTRKPAAATQVALPVLDLQASNIEVTYDQPGRPTASLNVPQFTLVADEARTVQAAGNGNVALGDDGGDFTLDLTVRNAVAQDGTLQLGKAAIEGEANLDRLPIDAIDRIAGLDGLLTAAIGDANQNYLTLDLETRLAEGATAGTARLTAQAPRLNIDLTAKPTPDGTLAADGATATFTLTPEFVARFAKDANLDLAIDANKTLQLTATTLRIPASGNAAEIELAATITADDLALSGDPMWDGLTLRDLQLDLPQTTLDQTASLTANAALIDPANAASPTSVRATLMLSPDPQGGPPSLGGGQVNLFPVPLALIERFGGDQPALDSLLGGKGLDTVAIGFEGNPTAVPLNFSAVANGGSVLLVADAAYANEGITLKPGTEAKLNLAPAQLDALLAAINPPSEADPPAEPAPPTPSILAEPANLTARVASGFVPLPFNLADVAINATASAPTLALTRKDAAPQRIADTTLAINSDRLADAINVQLRGRVVHDTPPATPATQNTPAPAAPSANAAPTHDDSALIESNTTVTSLISPQGVIDVDTLAFTTNSQLRALPIALVDQLANNELKLEPILGNLANVRLAGDFPGDLTLHADSPTADLNIDANIDNKRRLSLNRDLTAQLWVTPEMSDKFLGKIHPMFQDARSSEQPVQLTIDSSMRKIPLTGFKLEDLNLKGTLDGGTLNMTRTGWLNGSLTDASAQFLTLISLGNIRATPDRNARTYPATFTPMEFTIKRNIVDTSQVWVTAPDLAVGFVGSVDLSDIQNPPIRNMTMGMLTASLILERPELSIFLQPDQVAELPLKGVVTDPKPDFGVLTSDIAGAGVVGTLSNLTGGLLGGLSEELAKSLRKNAKYDWQLPPAAQELVTAAENTSLANDDSELNQEQLDTRNQRRGLLEDLLGNIAGDNNNDSANDKKNNRNKNNKNRKRNDPAESPDEEDQNPAERLINDLLGR